MSKTKARFQSVEFRDEVYGVKCLCIPGAQARPFIERAKLIAGLVPACTAEEIAAQGEFINQCDEYLATLPKEE